jgi:hypothetical protein
MPGVRYNGGGGGVGHGQTILGIGQGGFGGVGQGQINSGVSLLFVASAFGVQESLALLPVDAGAALAGWLLLHPHCLRVHLDGSSGGHH